MNIKRTSPLMQFYLTANKRYPKDFCTLFWGSLWALLVSPISLLGVPFILFKKEVRKFGLNQSTGNQTFNLGSWVFISYAIISEVVAHFLQEPSLWKALIVIAIFVVGFFAIAIVVGIVFHIGIKGFKMVKAKAVEKTPSVLSAWIKDYKGKHCSMLTVIEDKPEIFFFSVGDEDEEKEPGWEDISHVESIEKHLEDKELRPNRK